MFKPGQIVKLCGVRPIYLFLVKKYAKPPFIWKDNKEIWRAYDISSGKINGWMLDGNCKVEIVNDINIIGDEL